MEMSSPSDAHRELPDIDDRLVAPESGYEIDDGKLVRVPPALEPHADRHAKLAALLEAHVAEDFNVALDMLTRTSETSDIAPDASVYPRARTATGGRQLDHLAFEIAVTETLAHSGGKAAKLTGRGVRRVFAIDVRRARVFEWSSELGTWSMLDPAASIEDPALAVPLSVETLIRVIKADDAVAKALLAKRNPVLEAALEDRTRAARLEGRLEGESEGKAEAILEVLSARGLEPQIAERTRILGERDPTRLRRWLVRAVTSASVAEVLLD